MLKLLITDPNYQLPDSYRDQDGFHSIYIPESVAASLNWDNANLSELGKIISSFTNTFELIADQRTQNILTRVHFRRNREGMSAKIQGAIWMDGQYYPGLLLISSSSENIASGNIRYRCQFIGTHQTWKEAARNTSICQIDNGNIFNSAENLEDSWDNDVYTPGGQPFYFPLVSKGAWLNPSYRIVEDFDFICVFFAHMILEGFCRLGYSVESEFVNTTEFRKKAAYLMSDAFFNQDGINKFGKFRASLTVLQTSDPTGYFSDGGIIEQPNFTGLITGLLFNDDFTLPVNSDVNNLYLPVTGQFSGYNGSIAFSTSVNFEVIPQDPASVIFYQDLIDNEPIQAKLVIRVNTLSGGTYDIAESQTITVTHSTLTTLSVISPEVNLFSTDEVYVDLVVTRLAYNISSWHVEMTSGYFSSQPRNNIIQRNQLLTISSLLDCEITFYNILEELTRLYNLQYYTNEVEKKVYIEPEYKWQDWSGLPHSGIRREINNAYDITRLLNTAVDIEKDFTSASEKRYMQFFFANSSDYHTVRYNEENKRELHSSNRIEVGDTGNEVEEMRMAIFQPIQTIYDESGYQDPYSIQVPAVWNGEPDTASGSPYPKERAYSIGGRVLHIHGMTLQNNKYGNLPVWYFEDTTQRNAYPKAYQINKDNPANSSVVFGSEITNKNQINTFFKNLAAIKQSIVVSGELTLRSLDIARFDLRNPVLLDSAVLPPSIAGYYYVKKLQALYIASDVKRGLIDMIPLNFVQQCEMLCNLTIDYTSSNPTESGAEDGTINIVDIEGYTGLVNLTVTNSEGVIIFTQIGIDPLADLPFVIPDLLGGVYIVSLIDESGCTVQHQVILTNPCETGIDADGVNPSTEGGTDGSITINGATGVVYPLAVIVKQGAANVFSQSGVVLLDFPITVTNLSASTYTVIIIDSAGCSTSMQIQLTDTGDCNAPTDFAVFSATDTAITLSWTLTVGHTYNVRYKLASELVWTTLTGVTPNLLISGLDPCLNYEFDIETLCDDESLGFTEESIFGTTDCPCTITFTVTPLEGAGIAITDIVGLSEGASAIISVTDCEGNPIPNWWEAVPECYNVCVIDSCTCCRGCNTACFITLDEPVVSECDEETGTVSVMIDVTDTNLVGDLIMYYSMNGVTWFSAGLSTPGVGWLLASVPGTGDDLYIVVQNPDDALCSASVTIELPNCCENDLGLTVQCEPVVQAWTRNFVGFVDFIEFTLFGVTYTAPVPIDITDLVALNAYFNSLGLDVHVLWVAGILAGEPQIIVFPHACSELITEDFFSITVTEGIEEEEIVSNLVYIGTATCAEAQAIIPEVICPECCDCFVAIPTGTAAFIDTDVIEYSTDGGVTWLPYTSLDCINPALYPPMQTVDFRRTTTFTNGCPPSIITGTANGCSDCEIEITSVEASGLEPCNEFWYYETDDTLPDTADFVEITIAGVTYTPAVPIAASDIVALQTYLNSLTVLAKFRVTDSGVGYINVYMFTGCGDPISASFDYDDGGVTTINFTEPEVQLTCEDVQFIIPDFDCNVGCNVDGTVSITVTFVAGCTSAGNVLVTLSGGVGGGNVPAEDGTATFTSILATGQTVTVTMYDSEIEGCSSSMEVTLPDCSIPYGMNIECGANACNEDSYFVASFGATIAPAGTITSFTIDSVVYTPGAPLAVNVPAAILAYLNGLGLQFTFYVNYVAPFNMLAIMMASNNCCSDYDIADFEINTELGGIPSEMAQLGGNYTCAEIQTSIPAFVCCPDECFTATGTGFSGAPILTDVIEYSFNGTDWFVGNACIAPAGTLYFRRSMTFTGEDPVVITYQITDFEHCGCYNILDVDTDEIIGGEDDCE